MPELRLTGYYSPKEAEQLLREAVWLLYRYSEAIKEGDALKISKWKKKWENWGKAHPNAKRQIEEQIIGET